MATNAIFHCQYTLIPRLLFTYNVIFCDAFVEDFGSLCYMLYVFSMFGKHKCLYSSCKVIPSIYKYDANQKELKILKTYIDKFYPWVLPNKYNFCEPNFA